MKFLQKILAFILFSPYNWNRCDNAMMWNVAAHAGRELSRSMSDFKLGDKGRNAYSPGFPLGLNMGTYETPGCVVNLLLSPYSTYFIRR